MYTVYMLCTEDFAIDYTPDKIHFINFDEVLRAEKYILNVLKNFLPNETDTKSILLAIERVKQKETKTKATNIRIDRNELWSNEAEQVYDFLGFEKFLDKAKALGMRLDY